MLTAVTGAFGYSGRYIARRLLDAGHAVITLTKSLNRENPFGAQVQAFPFNFDHPEQLKVSLRGTDVLMKGSEMTNGILPMPHPSSLSKKSHFQRNRFFGDSRKIHQTHAGYTGKLT
ncbi:MAG TPA: NAD-dependent epimerase/dehydratase family protein [Verrucomicrobiae bacterium]|jgi:putative NADH-flavin reductase|nr:NAD-dependent epimerase/dehydratase family protein [Verrucomicrobiae bacterium]